MDPAQLEKAMKQLGGPGGLPPGFGGGSGLPGLPGMPRLPGLGGGLPGFGKKR
jgi:signal recognition particle subunit SRP54